MRNNEELYTINNHLLNFLKEHLIKEGESDEDFFISFSNISLLEEKSHTDQEKEMVSILRRALEGEIGQSGMDIYYE